MPSSDQQSDRTTRTRWLSRGVIAIGMASLLSDVGHEMATAVLPSLLVSLGGTAAALGVIEGAADFCASLAKLYAGYYGARTRRKKWAASAGYAVTALAKGSMALATVWPHLLVARTVGWIGRGFRSPLRDALLAEQVEPPHFGKAFGVERAMDSAGAVLGPVITLALLSLATPLRTIFLVTLIPGLIAAGLILWGVREKPKTSEPVRGAAPIPVPFRRFLLAVGLFGCGDFSRTMLLLWAAVDGLRSGSPSRLSLPILLYIGYNIVQSISSYVGGALSDHFGQKPVLLVGYGSAVAVTLVMVFDFRTMPVLMIVFAGSGIYMGIQEAVERAAAASLLAPASRSVGFGWLATVNGIGDLLASMIVGALWSSAGPGVAFGYAATVMLLGTLLLAGTTWAARPD